MASLHPGGLSPDYPRDMEIAAIASTSPLVIPSQGDAQRAEHASEESLASLRILGRKWQIPRWRVANAPLARNDTLERAMEIAATCYVKQKP